CATLKAW
nr:immunoglobulin heavy chain junction region [Macaca mulatta]MOV35620.1 immunoglobulin heavy chain junction region [Macaca mulatta]MOV35622.1 immunoglobulin heavy chain junction region [Macaca mulatta]MOV35647.1 immunoglobulin heavy chain junction region [Macaca mulatta]